MKLVTTALFAGLLGGFVPAAFAQASAPAGFVDLAARCAPQVHPQTLAAVIAHESGFNPLAIGVNGSPAVQVRAKNLAEAVGEAERLITSGRNIDMGLGQINSANLKWLGLSVREVFDPCTNVAAASRVLVENYRRQAARTPSAQQALDAALSQYNTGDARRGLVNGYVAKVRRKAGLPVPVLDLAVAQPQPAPAWDAFGKTTQQASAQTISKTGQRAAENIKPQTNQGVYAFGRSL